MADRPTHQPSLVFKLLTCLLVCFFLWDLFNDLPVIRGLGRQLSNQYNPIIQP